MDFGIARLDGGPAPRPRRGRASRRRPAARREPTRRRRRWPAPSSGPSQYMAPEQAQGRAGRSARRRLCARPDPLRHAARTRTAPSTPTSALDELRSAHGAGAAAACESSSPTFPSRSTRSSRAASSRTRPSGSRRRPSWRPRWIALDEHGKPLPDQARRRPAADGGGVVAAARAARRRLVVRSGSSSRRRSTTRCRSSSPTSRTAPAIPTFDRTLEPMLKRALEGAGFISAYDRNGISRTLGVQPPEKLDEAAARELAVKQGLGVVLSGVDRPPGQRLRRSRSRRRRP